MRGGGGVAGAADPNFYHLSLLFLRRTQAYFWIQLVDLALHLPPNGDAPGVPIEPDAPCAEFKVGIGRMSRGGVLCCLGGVMDAVACLLTWLLSL